MSQSVLRKVKGRARKAAEILPFSIKEVGYREFVSGRELLQQKIETIADKPVDPDLKYIQTKIKVEKIDHFKEMMKYVKKHGEVGIGRYIPSFFYTPCATATKCSHGYRDNTKGS